MRNLIFSLMLSVFSLVAFSQTYEVSVSGEVTDMQTGEPVEGQAVDIMTDSTAGGFSYFNTVFTDDDGHYEDEFDVPEGDSGTLTVSTMSCGMYLSQSDEFSEENDELEFDFVICTDMGDDCQAMFSHHPAANDFMTIEFTDMSDGNPTEWDWDFGDGTGSELQNPEHTYTTPGFYTVSLTVSGGGLGRSITKLDYIEVLPENTPSVAFSHQHGFFESSFNLTLTTATADAEIRYTLDGTEPTADDDTVNANGETYSGPLTISTTATVRAGVFVGGTEVSKIYTQTYIFLDDVVAQSANGGTPSGWPTGVVNTQIFDYTMDPEVTQDGAYSPIMKESLMAIKTLSIVTDLDNLTDPATGIYVNAKQSGRAWERPVSVELLDPDGGATFQVGAGLRIRGNWSRRGDNAKHAFRLYFRSEYGDSKLRFPLFGDEGVGVFDKLGLRTSSDYSWHLGDMDGDGLGDLDTMNRDVFSRDTQRDMGQPYTRSRYYHLYINGVYWGVYQSQERVGAEFAESYLGGDATDYDTIKRNSVIADGNAEGWTALWEATVAGYATDEAYYKVLGKNPDGTDNPLYPKLVNLDNLIPYMLIIDYTGNN
ncbi:MAG: PKD domain-containing protein, partial [Bacteroidales bacterium]|nr:PKD domain-containing protein [Bacteroidales bacterium]